jgi:hypothetical protein
MRQHEAAHDDLKEALHDCIRDEKHAGASIERGVSDLEARRTRTTEEVLDFLRERRDAFARQERETSPM